MSKSHIAEPFTVDEISFRACFSAPSLELFAAMVTGWVLTVGRHTISNVILTMGLHESRHFASVYRFVGRGRWLADMVSYVVFMRLLETLAPCAAEILVVVDDTLNKHRGKKISGAGWQHDGSAPPGSNRKGYGVCFVIIGLAVRLKGITDRVVCLPYAARLWWPPRTKTKPRSMAYKTKSELAVELIKLTHSWTEGDRVIRVVGDLHYSCETVINGLPPGTHMTGRIRKGSALYELPPESPSRGRGRPRKKGCRMPTPEAMFQDRTLPWEEIRTSSGETEKVRQVYAFTAIWYHAVGNKPLRFVLSRDLSGTYADTVFVDTDLCATSHEVIGRYAARSSIEVTNRETKELLGAADPQCRSELSVARAPLFAYWAYSLVVLWFVRHFQDTRFFVAAPGPWYRHKKNFSFSDMLAAARRSHFRVIILKESCQQGTLSKFNPARSARQTSYKRNAKL
jgi:hypothetical protein